LDAAAAVDEVEEHQLPHVSAGEDPAGEAVLVGALGFRVEQIGLGANGRDLLPVREAFRQRH
jgi:hypothetical protein